MAVVNTLSTTAAPLAHPQNAGQVTGQRTKLIRTIVSIANGDSIGSSYLLGQVPDTAVVKSITLEGATISGLTNENIGIYDSKGNVKSATVYANGNINLSSSTGLPTGDTGNPVWRAGSRALSSVMLQEAFLDAGDVIGPVPAVGSNIKDQKYQIALILLHAATAAGTLLATVEYQCAE
jgi:hypothetical protein